MRRLTFIVLSSLALGGAAFAGDKSAPAGSTTHDMQKTDKVKGPPNAHGAMKDSGGADTTGTAGGGAASAKATGEAEGRKPGSK